VRSTGVRIIDLRGEALGDDPLLGARIRAVLGQHLSSVPSLPACYLMSPGTDGATCRHTRSPLSH